MGDTLPDFLVADLASVMDKLPPAVVNALPYGAVLLDAKGRVVFYNETERRLSGYRRDTLSRLFFIEIAPCMNTPEFRGRIDDALARGALNISFDYVGDFNDATRLLHVRVQSATNGGCWIFIRRT